MKRSFIHTAKLLQAVLLLGVLSFVNTPAKAQTAEQWAAMPNAFETKTPVIGDGNYYYIQFFEGNVHSFLGEYGMTSVMRGKDYVPFSNSIQWTLESTGTDGEFYLKSKRGNYICKWPTNDAYCGASPTKDENSYKFTLNELSDGYYEIVKDSWRLGRENGNEWGRIRPGFNSNSPRARVRFATLKPNAAHIIYYREETKNDNYYPNNNLDNPYSETRHYLTYSGTTYANHQYWRESTVSSRKSIIPSDMSLWTLPTAAAYHQDGLWTLEGTGSDGEFYIKKYGTEEYLNAVERSGDWFYISDLGTKNDVYGKYTLEDPNANRYSRVLNVQYQTDDLTSNMFNNWNGYGAGASSTGTATVDNNINTAVSGGTSIIGPQNGYVTPWTYADLSNYTKMVIRGTEGMALRVLMNRQETDKGPWFEKNVTIGNDGTALIDLNTTVGQAGVKATYINGDDGAEDTSYGLVTTALCGYNRISDNNTVVLGNKDWGENDITYLQVDASAINGTITKVMLAGEFQGNNNHDLYYGVGYNSSTWSADLTWNTADRSITLLGNTQTVERNTNEKTLSFDITGAFTDSKVKTILVYKDYAYSGYIKNPRVYVEYIPNDGVKCVHLNAIKAGWGDAGNGTVTSVSLVNQGTVDSSSPRYLNYGEGDGWQVFQWTGDDAKYWYAGFYPVEVPVPNKDEYYQVLVGLRSSAQNGQPTEMVNYSGTASPYSEAEGDRILWQLEQVDDYLHFRLKRPDTGEYLAGYNKMTAPNDPDGAVGTYSAEVYTNQKFFNDFTLKWFFVNPVDKEIVVDHYVRHKESYLRAYADDQVIANQEGLRKQGLATDKDSEWKNFNGNLDGMTQKTNHFEITHYIKKGNTSVIEFPTVLNRNNDHVYFQRFYHYDEVDEGADGNGMDLENLKAHVSLDTRDDGNVQYFLYKNGMVTGQKLDWYGIEDGGYARNEQRRFNFTNSDGQSFTVGVDVSRYSDLKYLNEDEHLNGDLQEPSLTMRYIFYMNDANDMAKRLTACPEGGTKWLEEKTFHFGRTQVPYTKFKKVGYRGEFIPIRHVFSDYWVYDDPQLIDESYLASLGLSDDELKDYLDRHLVSAVNDNNGGKIEVEIDDDDDNPTGIRLGGWNPNIDLRGYTNEGNDADYQGFYFYDKIARNQKTLYGNSRFVVFRYPASGQVNVPTNTKQEAKLNVFFNAGNGRRYQLAQYTIIFDANMATRPWTEIKNGTSYANGINKVKDEDRDPNKLRLKAGKPIAKVSFDFPEKMVLSGTEQDAYYHYPQQGETIHNSGWGSFTPNEENNYTGTIANSSPVPLTFDHTNYSFDGDGCNWGSYALVTTKKTDWGNQKTILPADDAVYGYNIDADPGMRKAFLYIDASEQPGDICAMNFEGEFCANDKLMCSGWISGSNRYNDDGEHRCPGSITITIKGEDINGNTKTIYRFCPGQIYELDNGYGDDGHGYAVADVNAAGNDGSGNEATHVVWQQFFFEFSTDQKYERYWLEVNNNCVSSNGGDFMIDNVEVYTIVPEVEPEINTPLCVSVDENGQTVTEMRLLKLDVNFNKLKSSAAVTTGTAKVGFVFLEKEVFLKTLWTRKTELSQTYADLDAFAQAIKEGKYLLDSNDADYRAAFDAALLGEKKIWNSTSPTTNMGSGIMYYQWSSTFEDNNVQPVYSFAKAVNKQGAVFRYEDEDGQWLVFNGNYPGLNWKTNTDYYIVPSNTPITNPDLVYSTFNILSECSKASVFQIEPPLEVVGLDATENTEDLVVCEGQTPTLLTNLKGYDINGNVVMMDDLNFDWWLGNKTAELDEDKRATLENYHKQHKEFTYEDAEGVTQTEDVYLAYALATMRAYYPGVTSLDGIMEHKDNTPYLTMPMIQYLREVVDKGELLLHQSAISVPAERVLESDPYFYLVACPIHDEMFSQALNPSANEYVAFYCDEPQGVRIRLGAKAPTLQTGFVPGEHGFSSYNYNFPANTNPVLSIRLAKAAQFEMVKNTENEGRIASEDVNYLWLPIRNAKTEAAQGVIKMSDDDNIYLAASNDLTWDKKISKELNKNGSLPVVGRIVQLRAVNTKEGATVSTTENAYNRLAVYFNKGFDVREGYNYTLSLPFQEEPDPESGETVNICDGTILINLKIVPDYEVWTGAAGNIDWNNDENWRRADGNTSKAITSSYDVYGDELYRANGAEANEDSPLHTYTTNKANYYSSSTKKNAKPSSDQILRKGFAPLYCTHVLMKSDEWGNAPELYDGLDAGTAANNTGLNDAPFPNLRETSTPILKFDMQARKWNMWEETYGEAPDRGRGTDHPNDLIAEMYQINSCDEIAFQPGTELRNAHLLNYNNAWVEYQIDNKRWYLLGSPLQGTISGEWYAPTGTAKQKTTYYDPIRFSEFTKVLVNSTDNPAKLGYYKKEGQNYIVATEEQPATNTDYYIGHDRYSPAIYQRSWDKAKAVLYEVGSEYETTDDSQTLNLGSGSEGLWEDENEDPQQDPDWQWNVDGGGTADEYLDRLGYKPMGGKKANVAIKGIWSNTYNDAQVDYATGGFSVMVMNHLKGNDQSGEILNQSTNEKKYSAIIRLPKEDTMYDYYKFNENGGADGGTDTELSVVQEEKDRALNRGRLKADKLLPDNVSVTVNNASSTVEVKKKEKTASIYGDTRDYTRVPTTEAALQTLNSGTFSFTETVPAGISDLGFYLVENPFPCGLDMNAFFAGNTGLEEKYWLLTATGQHLVQKAGDAGEWITSDGTNYGKAKKYSNPNYVAPEDGEPEPTEPKTLPFYPHAVVAPGQGFFVQAKVPATPPETPAKSIDITFTKDMQAQSRFGMIEGKGKKYVIVVGQSQETKKMYDADNDGIPETPLLDQTYEGETIMIDTDGNGEPDTEKNVFIVPQYEEEDDPENPGQTIKIPKLIDIEDEVVIYKYVPEKLTIPDDPETEDVDESETIEKEYTLLSRRTRSTDLSPMHGLVITAKRGTDQSSALVMKRESASDDFLPSEDTETFIFGGELQSPAVPTVYTLCGRLATTINSIHDFTCLPLGVESNSDAPCTLTFQGVEQLGDSVAFYDAVERKLTPLESGMKFTVSGQTQNRYYIVSSLNEEEVAEETHLQIFTEGRTAKVIASTAEPITDVRCFDAAGRLVHSANPQTMEYSFTLPDDGIYIIEAKTEKDRKTKKVAVK